jgi:hypothetical protein
MHLLSQTQQMSMMMMDSLSPDPDSISVQLPTTHQMLSSYLNPPTWNTTAALTLQSSSRWSHFGIGISAIYTLLFTHHIRFLLALSSYFASYYSSQSYPCHTSLSQHHMKPGQLERLLMEHPVFRAWPPGQALQSVLHSSQKEQSPTLPFWSKRVMASAEVESRHFAPHSLSPSQTGLMSILSLWITLLPLEHASGFAVTWPVLWEGFLLWTGCWAALYPTCLFKYQTFPDYPITNATPPLCVMFCYGIVSAYFIYACMCAYVYA